MPDTQQEYLSRKAAAEKLGKLVRGRPYNERTLINWELDGKGPPVTRVGRDVAYYWPNVEKWLRAQERAAKGSTNANAA
jgi:hypothetical protein